MMRSLPLLLLSLAPIGVLSQRVTRDATCGGSKGYTCLGSSFGNCCSQYGWCGSTEDYCGKGCNSKFGRCNTVAQSSSSSVKPSSSTRASSVIPSTPSSQPVSNNARCGASFGGRTCLGSKWGDCCSQYGYCGSTKDYCAASTCQKGYGKCNTVSSSSTKPSISSKASSAASSQVNPAPPSPIVSSTSARISPAASASASTLSSASVSPSLLSASQSATPSSLASQPVSSAASVGQSSASAGIISSSSASVVALSSSGSSSNVSPQQSSSAAPISSIVPSVGSSSSQAPSEGVASQSSSAAPSVPQSSVLPASSDVPSNSVPSQSSSVVPSSSVNNDSPPFTPTASVVLPSDPEEFLATYTFQDDPLPTPIAMGSPPIDGGAGAELSIPQKCMIVPGQGDATFQLLEPKDRVPLTKRTDGTFGPIPAPKSEAEFLAMPPIDELKITSFALVSSSNGLFDLVSTDSPRKYVAKKADGSVTLVDQSTNDAQTTTSIFDVTCEGRITIRIDTQYYSWALNGEATTMEKVLDKTDTMYTLPDNPSAVTRRRRSKSQEGIAPRCNAYPRDLEARVFPGARGNNPNKCGSSSFKVPDLTFGHCCDQHDNDFDNCGMTFEEGNNAFRNCMRGSGCEQFNKWYLYLALVGCRKTADFYYSVVSGYFGMKAFYQANSDRCKCYCPSSSPHGCMVNGQFQCLNVFSTDTNNCGACGRVCPQGSRCENGQCKCPAQQCGDRCISLSSHPRNCGQCGRVSPSGYCVQGQFYSPPAFCSRGNGFRNGNFANGANYWNAQIVSGGGNSRFDVGGDGGAEDSDRMVGIFSLYAPNGGANLKTSVKMCPGTAYNLQFQIRRPYGTDNCNYYVYLAGELKRTGPVPQPTNIGAGWVWVNGMRAGPFFGERQGVSAAGPELWAEFQLDIRCSGGAPYNFIRVDQFSINPA